MSVDTVFKPIGPLTLVGIAAIKVCLNDGSGMSTYRVRNTAGTVQYFTWGVSSTVVFAGIPTAGAPSPNTIGMLAGSIETFEIPAGVYFIGNVGSAFEFTAGQGA